MRFSVKDTIRDSANLLRAAVSITLEQQDKDEALGRLACTTVQIRE